MERRKLILGIAAGGAAAGIALLSVIAAPAGADPAPKLPDISADQLVDKAVEADATAFGGTVAVDNSLGLPEVAGLPQIANGSHEAQVWYDGGGRYRLSLPDGDDEQTIVNDGTTLWTWDSAGKAVTKSEVPADSHAGAGSSADSEDPTAQAQQLLAIIRETSEVSVDGTAQVADRPAYELVLTPKPTERTVLREVRVAVDAETWLPLQLSVYANNVAEPVLQIGFTSIDVGAQDPSLFTFTVPEGATVTESEPKSHEPGSGEAVAQFAPQQVGEGWDSVLVAASPSGLPSQTDGENGEGNGQDVESLLEQVGTPVSGAWGNGWLITTKAGSALITSDGRIAIGAVPEQVLVEALGKVK